MNSKIDCLKLLDKKINCISHILLFLRSEKIISIDKFNEIINEVESMRPAMLYYELEDAFNKDKLQLVDYLWEILPVERIVVTIVTDTVRRDFAYNN